MKGLLLKDCYTLLKQLKIFILVLAFLSFVSGFSTLIFVVVYAVMLPITALAYDERSKWNTLAAMMPYSAKSMVLSKYVLGYISIAGATALFVISQAAMSLVKKTPFVAESFLALLPAVCIATVVQSINLPVMFRLGVEKGRLILFILVAAIAIGGMTLGDRLAASLTVHEATVAGGNLAVVAGALLINIVSILISIGIYRKKR